MATCLKRSLAIFTWAFIALFPLSSSASGESASSAAKNPATVISILTVTNQRRSKVVINLTGKPVVGISSVLVPPSMWLDLGGAVLSSELARVVPVNDGRVKGIELFQKDGSSKIIIGLEEGTVSKVSFQWKETCIITVEMRGGREEAGKGPKTAKEATLLHRSRTPVLGGYIKNETAYRVSRPKEPAKIKNIFYPSVTGSLLRSVSYKASGRLVYDAVYDLTDNYAKNVEGDQRLDKNLRDFFLDISKGDWDLRAGRQQIVWGEAVGLFFADIVNAKDLREFILPDFDYIRIPHWAVDLEYAKESFHLEFVLIPVLEFNRFGEAGSEFPAASPVPDGVAAISASPEKPRNSAKNSEIGARVSYLTRGWDISLFHFYSWDKTPVKFRTVTSPSLHSFRPEYRRLNISGLTVAKEMSGIVLKGEFVYNRGKFFSVLDSNDLDGLVRLDYLDYLIGADYTVLERVDLNVQFMQRIIFGFDNRVFREDKVRSMASLRAGTGFMENRLEPEILIISSLREHDMLLRPRVDFRYSDRLRLRAGIDIFDGVPDGMFGQYKDRDRVYGEARYDF